MSISKKDLVRRVAQRVDRRNKEVEEIIDITFRQSLALRDRDKHF